MQWSLSVNGICYKSYFLRYCFKKCFSIDDLQDYNKMDTSGDTGDVIESGFNIFLMIYYSVCAIIAHICAENAHTECALYPYPDI